MVIADVRERSSNLHGICLCLPLKIYYHFLAAFSSSGLKEPRTVPIRSCNGGNELYYRREQKQYKVLQRSNNNSANRLLDPLSSPYMERRVPSQRVDGDILGLPVGNGCDQEYAFDPELGLPNPPNFSPPPTRNNRNWSGGNKPFSSAHQYPPEIQKAIESILFIANHIRKDDDENNVSALDPI